MSNPLEISLKFNSIDEAIDVLLKLRTRQNDHLTEKANSAKAVKSTKAANKPHFKNMPVKTLENILSTLFQRYPDRPFGRPDIKRLQLQNQAHPASSSLVGYALQYGVSIGKLHRLSLGLYSFKAPADTTKYTPAKDSLIDIMASEQQTTRLVSIFRLMGHVCKSVSLYINEQGISARFFTNQDRTAMLSVFVGKEVFSTYHVKAGKHVRLVISLSNVLGVFTGRRKGEFHMIVEKENATTLKVGRLGNEHTVNVIECNAGDTAFEIEKPLEEPKGRCAELHIARSLFEDRLMDVYCHSDTARIAISNDKFVIDTSLENSGYSKTLTTGEDIQIQASENIQQCFIVKDLLAIVRHRIAGHDGLILKINKQVMMMDLAIEKDLRVSCYISPCKIETEKKPFAEEIKELKEKIEDLKKQVNI
jgi:hypothetical protein